MVSVKSNMVQGVLRVVQSGTYDNGQSPLSVWKEICTAALEHKARAILAINFIEAVIQLKDVERLVELCSRNPALLAIANVRMVLPHRDDIEVFTVVKYKGEQEGIPMRTFYDEGTARDWINEILRG